MDKMIAERPDFKLGKRYLSELMTLMVQDFQEQGGKIKVGRPAFAAGCETKRNVRHSIRQGRRSC